jgi:hypothetical protein
MNEDYAQILYARAIEVQPQLCLLAQDLKSMGMSDEQVATELSFAMLHEGYRLRHMEQEQKNWEELLDEKVEEGKE